MKKWIMLTGLLLAGAVFAAPPQNTSPETVLVVAARGGSPEQEAMIDRQILSIRKIWPSVQIVRSKAELEAAGQTRPAILLLLGHGTHNAKRTSLVMSDGRLGADALLRYAGTQSVLLFNTMAAAFVPFFADRTPMVLSATDSTGQFNPPLLTDFFLAELEASNSRDLAEAFREAGKKLDNFFSTRHLARSEKSMMLRDGKAVLPPPPGEGQRLALVSPPPSSDAADKPAPPSEALQDATEETCSIARRAAEIAKKYPSEPGFFLSRHYTICVNPEKSAVVEMIDQLVFASGGGPRLPMPSGRHNGRLIRPDGKFQVLSMQMIPPVAPGSVLELHRTMRIGVSAHLPELEAAIPIQTDLPVESYCIRAMEGDYRIYFPNLATAPLRKSSAPSERSSWTIYASPPGKSLPPWRDPPDEHAAAAKRGGIRITTWKSWDDLLAWANRMTNRSLHLDDRARALTGKLIAEAKSPREKVRKIYDFLNSLRYVSVPLGGAAFRPLPPGEVLRLGAGDCKDKATALAAMCDLAGIKAERMLVNRGKEMNPDFPCWQFNHMIVYLPEWDLWLDPTDGFTPMGDLPPGDNGTMALSLDNKRQRFRRVRAQEGKNEIVRTFQWQPDGNFSITTRATGIFDYFQKKTMLLPMLPYQREAELKKRLQGIVPDADWIGYDFHSVPAGGESTLVLKGRAQVPLLIAEPLPELREIPSDRRRLSVRVLFQPSGGGVSQDRRRKGEVVELFRDRTGIGYELNNRTDPPVKLAEELNKVHAAWLRTRLLPRNP
ncbi:MAG: transglutaminase family protein [Victivallaceae bacterium]|nr:transglutaminase family protein [Victivallaceae bacterium]